MSFKRQVPKFKASRRINVINPSADCDFGIDEGIFGSSLYRVTRTNISSDSMFALYSRKYVVLVKDEAASGEQTLQGYLNLTKDGRNGSKKLQNPCVEWWSSSDRRFHNTVLNTFDNAVEKRPETYSTPYEES